MNGKAILITGLMCMLAGHQAGAADSTITVTGQVKEGGCTVEPASKTMTVDLSQHATRQLNRVGAVTQATPFTIVLTSCGSGTTGVRVGFLGVADSSNSALLGIEVADNAAAGVGVQLLDSAMRALRINDSALNTIAIEQNKETILAFNARIMTTRLPVSAGKVFSTTDFTLEYD